MIGYGRFVVKVQTYLQLVYAAEVCGGLGVLTLIKQIMIYYSQDKKIDLMLELDCQSAIHKFSSRQRVISYDSKLSYVVQELLYIKQFYINSLTIVKIVGYQDDVKRLNALSFLERLNIQCDLEAKHLIRD